MSKHPLNTDIKNECARIVKEITGQDIKKIIPEGENRLKLYQIYQHTWSEKENYQLAEKEARKWVRNWEKAKAAVCIAFLAIHKTEIKNKIDDASKRSELYWLYIEKGKKETINTIENLAFQ